LLSLAQRCGGAALNDHQNLAALTFDLPTWPRPTKQSASQYSSLRASMEHRLLRPGEDLGSASVKLT